MLRCAPILLLGLLGAALQACGDGAAPEKAGAPPRPDLDEMRSVFAAADREKIDVVLATLRRLDPPPMAWLLEGLTHPDRGVREWSAEGIGDVAPEHLDLVNDGTIAALLNAFEDDDDWVRWKAARALGRIGPAARDALVVLEAAAQAKQEAEIVRAAAKKAVALIKGDPYPLEIPGRR